MVVAGMAQLSVRDLLSRDFVGVSESDSVQGAVELMREDDETGAVVLHGSEPVGVLSAGDVLDCLADGQDLEATPVSEIMRQEPPDVTPETTVDEAAGLLSRSRGEHVVVSDENGVVGVIGVRDLATITWDVAEKADEIGPTAQGIERGQSEEFDTEYSNQSICEACGSLSRDLVNVNGQLLCSDCRSV